MILEWHCYIDVSISALCMGSHFGDLDLISAMIAVHGNWGQWTAWTSCSLSCGGGTRTRMRLCNAPSPGFNGRHCAGPAKQIDYCNREACESKYISETNLSPVFIVRENIPTLIIFTTKNISYISSPW